MDATEALVLQHQDYVRSLARGIARKLPHHVDFEELVAFGQVGLVEAAGKFKAGRGAAFTTFAYYRIRGAIFDGMRKMLGLPPSVRQQVAQMDAEDQVIETTAPQGEVSDDPEFLAKQFSEAAARLGAVFLLARAGEDDEDLEPATDRSAADEAEQKELVQRVKEAMASLEPEQLQVVRMVYFEYGSMTDCAAKLGVDKATISRRHARAIEHLRKALSG